MDTHYSCAYCGAEFIIQEIPPHKHLIAGLPDYEGSWYAECSGCTCALTAPTKDQLIVALNRRLDPYPLTPRETFWPGIWGRCLKCGKLNRTEYNYCANCGIRICPPKEDKSDD